MKKAADDLARAAAKQEEAERRIAREKEAEEWRMKKAAADLAKAAKQEEAERRIARDNKAEERRTARQAAADLARAAAKQEEAERRISREKEAEERRRTKKAAQRAVSPLKETAVPPTNERAGSPKTSPNSRIGKRARDFSKTAWSEEEDKQLKELRARGGPLATFTVGVLLPCCCCTGGWHTVQAASRSGWRGLVVRAFP